MKSISIIIPIYNVEKYLKRCLDSLFVQYTADMEVILVNDGSTDRSLEICEEYQKLYPDAIIINKENGGLSDARNVGTAIATGKYIYYLDSDDWISPHAITRLYQFAEKEGCQIVQSRIIYTEEGKEYTDDRWFGPDRSPFCMTREEAMGSLINDGALKNFAWGKLYLASIVQKYPFPKGKYFEDMYWQHLIVDECEKIGILTSVNHYYWQRPGSISSVISLRNLDLMRGYEERLGYIQQKYPHLVQTLADNYLKQLTLLIYLHQKGRRKDLSTAYGEYFKYAMDKYGGIFQTTKSSKGLYRSAQLGQWAISVYYVFGAFKNRIKTK